MNMGKFLQVNLNHCRGAQDLLLNQVGAWGVDVVMISEPYAVPKRGESRDGSWFGSEDGAATLLFSNSVRRPRHRELSEGEGFVLVGWGNAVLVSAYASPNRPVTQFENFLHALEREIDRFAGSRPSLVCGDFNAKYVSWSRNSLRSSARAISSCMTGGENLRAGHQRVRDRSCGFFRRSRGVGFRFRETHT